MKVLDSKNLAYEEEDIVIHFLLCWLNVAEVDGVTNACAQAAQNIASKKCIFTKRSRCQWKFFTAERFNCGSQTWMQTQERYRVCWK